MITTSLISRKQIAALLGDEVTPDQVRRNEERWGIRKARRDLNCRCVRYRTRLVLMIFRTKGWIE